MPSKRENMNIGHVVCGFHGCDQVAAVRKDSKGALYQECAEHGVIRSSQNAASLAIADNAVIWQEGRPPAGVPRWIAENWSATMRHYRGESCNDAHAVESRSGGHMPPEPARKPAPQPPRPAPAPPPPPAPAAAPAPGSAPAPEPDDEPGDIWKGW